MNERIGVCSWSLGPDSPVALAEALSTLGIEAVQLALVPCVNEPGTWGRAVEVLRASGIRIVSGMLATVGEDYSTLESIARTGGVRPDETWPRTRELADRVAAFAAAADIGLVTFHAGFLPHDVADPERARLMDRLRTVADGFGERGISVAFETGQETATTLAAVLDDLDRESVGVNFDPANMVLYGMGDPVEALRALQPWVRQVHIKDAVPTEQPGTWGAEVVAGTGAVDWASFFDVAVRIEPAVDFVIEREAGASRMADIAAARDLVRSFL